MLSALSAGFVGVLVVVAAQATSPDPNPADLWRLGGFVVALLVGAAITYRYTTLPERQRAEKAESRAEDAEKERIEAYKVTMPAVIASNDLANRVLAVLPGVEALIAPPRRMP